MTDQPAKLRSWIEEYWPDFDAFLQDMNDARTSERVTVFIGATMLDLVVRRILAAFMIDEPAIANDLLGSEGTGGYEPLSTFSSRILACYALGLIAEDERTAIDTIRRIRNSFAHRLSDKISEQSITDLTNNIANLVLPDGAKSMGGKTRRDIMRQSIVGLAFTLVGRIKQVTEHRRSVYRGGKISLWAAAHTAPTPPFGDTPRTGGLWAAGRNLDTVPLPLIPGP